MFKIILSDDEVVVSSDLTFPIFTTCYVQCESVYFPCEQWTDFTERVISIWTENLVRNRGRKKAKYILDFFDGPFRIDVTQKGTELFLQGINDRREPRIEFSYTCTYEELLRELLKAFRKLEKIIYLNDAFHDPERVKSTQWTITYYKDLINRELLQGKKA